MSDSEKEDNDEEVVDETKEEEKEEEEAEESIEFNYEQWLEELKAVQSGRDFLLHLDRLPFVPRTVNVLLDHFQDILLTLLFQFGKCCCSVCLMLFKAIFQKQRFERWL